MTDFNFFEPYLSTNKNINGIKWVIVAGGTITALFIVGTLAINNYQIISLKNDIKVTNTKINDVEFQKKLKKSEDALKKNSILKKYDDALTSITSNVKNRAIITPDFMKSISDTIPEGIYFDSMTVQDNKLTIAAKSKSRIAIGEIQHNLKGVGFIKDVFIDGINSDLGGQSAGEFSFSAKCALKEDFSNEDK